MISSKVGDYESARKYVSGYLAEKDSHVLAHKLYGELRMSERERGVSERAVKKTISFMANLEKIYAYMREKKLSILSRIK